MMRLSILEEAVGFHLFFRLFEYTGLLPETNQACELCSSMHLLNDQCVFYKASNQECGSA